jgi:hypothetical protein
MPTITTLLTFGFVALGLALTPGPNMIYLISRSISQGRVAALISLAGVALGFVFYMLCAAFGITALLLTVPYAYDALRFAGALYLLYLAWTAVKPGGRSPFQVKELQPDSKGRLVLMGFLTNVLNPKAAVLYLSLLPRQHPDGDQCHGECVHRLRRRFSGGVPGRTAHLARRAALVHGHGTGGPGGEDGDGNAASLEFRPSQSGLPSISRFMRPSRSTAPVEYWLIQRSCISRMGRGFR